MAALRRVLVANRGEIAVRVIRACFDEGLETVLAVSEADREQPRRAARRPRRLHRAGAPRPRATSTSTAARRRGARSPAATRCTRATASSPSAPSCADAAPRTGIAFVGPSGGGDAPQRRQGDRARASRATLGIAVGEGSDVVADERGRAARRRAASATRCCSRPRPAAAGAACAASTRAEELAGAWASAIGRGPAGVRRRRACSSSASSAARATSRSRCSATRTAASIHLGHRDCTLQRRYQKLVEEAPAPDLPDDARASDILDAADAADRRARLRGRGDRASSSSTPSAATYGFLEINARLQVEHPVTEMVTGIDIVREQLRIAGGEPLSIAPGGRRGHGPRDRGAHQRRAPRARLHAVARHASTRWAGAGRHRRARRHRVLPRLDRRAALRLAAGQGHRPRERPRARRSHALRHALAHLRVEGVATTRRLRARRARAPRRASTGRVAHALARGGVPADLDPEEVAA